MSNESEGELRVVDDKSSLHKPIVVFGKDVREIKCFRDSFICGICCGVVGGLGTFLFTSKIKLSTHVSMASLWVGVLSYWVPCRYKYETSIYLFEAARAGNLKPVNPKPKTAGEPAS